MESPAVALDGASLEMCEGFSCQDKFLHPPEVKDALLRLLRHAVIVKGVFHVLSEEIEASHLLHYGPAMWMWGSLCCLL